MFPLWIRLVCNAGFRRWPSSTLAGFQKILVVRQSNSASISGGLEAAEAKEASVSAASAEETVALGTNEVEKRRGTRRPIHPWYISVKYLDSEVYRSTYGETPVWVLFRRNFKGPMHLPPKTRFDCTPNGIFKTNTPCPICRDEYLVLDYRNIKLLTQFIKPQTGELVDNRRCHLCRSQYLKLRVELLKAQNCGYITFNLPFQNFDYRVYYPWWVEEPHFVEDEPGLTISERQHPFIKYPVHNPELIPEMKRRKQNPFAKYRDRKCW